LPAATPAAGEKARRGKIPTMRKLARVMVNVLTALSLAMCLGVYVLWVESYSARRDFWWARRGGRMCWAWSDSGDLGLTACRDWPSDEPLRALRHDQRSLKGLYPATWHAPHLLWWMNRSTLSWERLNLSVERGTTAVWLWPDGRTVTLADSEVLTDEDYENIADSAPIPFSAISVRHWMLASALALPSAARLAALAWRRVHRHRRLAHDLCPACGYDLRATPGRCPECGTEWGTEPAR
jgi:hypothetical protein